MDLGSYPYVTSSNTGVGALQTGLGFLPQDADLEKMGVFKAYLTRVGEGPFPTEDQSSEGDEIQKKGKEFGASTGRKRRVGYQDLVLLKSVCEQNNIDYLTITKADVIFDIEDVQTIKVCVGYEFEGQKVDALCPGMKLESMRPIVEELPNPYSEFQVFKKTKEVGPGMKKYFDLIEEKVGRPIRYFSYGPEREEIMEFQIKLER